MADIAGVLTVRIPELIPPLLLRSANGRFLLKQPFLTTDHGQVVGHNSHWPTPRIRAVNRRLPAVQPHETSSGSYRILRKGLPTQQLSAFGEADFMITEVSYYYSSYYCL